MKYFTSRMSYNYQVLIARKFSDKLSAQIAPTMIHRNLVENITDKNDLYALVGMARYKFTKRMAIGAEYAYRLSKYTQDMSLYHNSVGISLEFETGGHVFQIVASNSFGLVESQTIPFTTNDVTKGHLMIGFNIGRFFTL
jgi:predicted porin